MQTSSTNQLQENRLRSFDLRSEGAIDLVKDLLQSGCLVRIRVSGCSMRPFLKGSEIVTIKKTPATKLRRGDIVLYVNDENQPVLHRVVRLKRKTDELQLQTKGDGLRGLDQFIVGSQVLARIVLVEIQQNSKQVHASIDLTLTVQRIIAYLIACRQFTWCCYWWVKRTLLKRENKKTSLQ